MSSNNYISTTTHQDTRAHIPSHEEAGYEQSNPTVKARQRTDLPINPVTTRGQDPELYWLGKYGPDDRQERLTIDIRSLYRHEHIVPENLIKGLYRTTVPPSGQLSLNDMFGNALDRDELNKTNEYYQHPQDGWTNRLILGDSELVMASLLEREGMAGTVQCLYFDPPYGIKYGSNWQIRLNNRDVKDGKDEALSGEPEQIKAFRDTWELGIHSYLTYLRERLLLAKELLTESGSCFVQISDVNVHLVRNLMDEVFGSENFVSVIVFKTSSPLGNALLAATNDYIVWYAKNIEVVKYRQLYTEREGGDKSRYTNVELPDKTRRGLTREERDNPDILPVGSKVFTATDLASSGFTQSCIFDFEYNGKIYKTGSGRSWKTNRAGMQKLAAKHRITDSGKTIRYVSYQDDFSVQKLSNFWTDTTGELSKDYVVQTHAKVIQRCVLMTTDPGDLEREDNYLSVNQ